MWPWWNVSRRKGRKTTPWTMYSTSTRGRGWSWACPTRSSLFREYFRIWRRPSSLRLINKKLMLSAIKTSKIKLILLRMLGRYLHRKNKQPLSKWKPTWATSPSIIARLTISTLTTQELWVWQRSHSTIYQRSSMNTISIKLKTKRTAKLIPAPKASKL